MRDVGVAASVADDKTTRRNTICITRLRRLCPRTVTLHPRLGGRRKVSTTDRHLRRVGVIIIKCRPWMQRKLRRRLWLASISVTMGPLLIYSPKNSTPCASHRCRQNAQPCVRVCGRLDDSIIHICMSFDEFPCSRSPRPSLGRDKFMCSCGRQAFRSCVPLLAHTTHAHTRAVIYAATMTHTQRARGERASFGFLLAS